MPPPDSEHATIASLLFSWLLKAGWPPEQVLQAVGVRITGGEGAGGRIADVTVWRSRRPVPFGSRSRTCFS